MKTMFASIGLFLTGFFLVQAGETASDLELMQGKWVVVSLTELGKAVPSAETDVLLFTIEKDVLTVTEKGQTAVQYKIVLDGTKKPKEINFTHQIGENKGKTEPGIYQFDKDQLKMSLDEKRKSRPTVFEGQGSETYSVIVLKKKG